MPHSEGNVSYISGMWDEAVYDSKNTRHFQNNLHRYSYFKKKKKDNGDNNEIAQKLMKKYVFFFF